MDAISWRDLFLIVEGMNTFWEVAGFEDKLEAGAVVEENEKGAAVDWEDELGADEIDEPFAAEESEKGALEPVAEGVEVAEAVGAGAKEKVGPVLGAVVGAEESVEPALGAVVGAVVVGADGVVKEKVEFPPKEKDEPAVEGAVELGALKLNIVD